MHIKAIVEGEFYNDECEINYKNNIKFEVASNKSLLLSPCSAKHHVPENIISMIELNIMRSSLVAKPVSTTVNLRFLTSAANSKHKNIQDIYTKMPDINRIR